MAALGQCEHPDCRRTATRAVRLADMTRTVPCCEQHATDFRVCDANDCERLSQVVIAIGRRRFDEGGRREVWLCRSCAERFSRAPSVTIDGRRMINHRAGWLLPLPRNVGRG